jgi:hypothetical protein
MSITLPEAEAFLKNNSELLNEMVKYQEKMGNSSDEAANDDDKIISQYHKLKTYILEKKMGLLNAGSRSNGGGSPV